MSVVYVCGVFTVFGLVGGSLHMHFNVSTLSLVVMKCVIYKIILSPYVKTGDVYPRGRNVKRKRTFFGKK